LFLLRIIVVAIVVITIFIALLLYCTFKIYSAIRQSSRKCVINSVFSVQRVPLAFSRIRHCAVISAIRFSLRFVSKGYIHDPAAKVSEKVNRKLPAKNTNDSTASALTLYIDSGRHNAQRTDRQTGTL